MTSSPPRDAAESSDTSTAISILERNGRQSRSSKNSLIPSFLASAFSIFDTQSNLSLLGDNKELKRRGYGWMKVMSIVGSNTMRRFHERLLGAGRTEELSSTGEIWFLGKCYNVSQGEESGSNGFPEFLEDFNSRIWITYRKGFEPIGHTKFTSDVGWGCMIRSSQMLVAQGLLFHHLGRSWRKPAEKPYDPEYVAILHHFGDSETRAFSIHNLIEAGKGYGLSSGSWLGPYAACRAWETLIRAHQGQHSNREGKEHFPLVVYVVSGDADGERGGAPVVCVNVASRLCAELSNKNSTWAPILLLVPLVLGLESVNPRYMPLLKDTFKFPQSLGIIGGKPGASTYIVGVQDDKALYLDPHEAQQVVEFVLDDLNADTSSYHCSTVRHLSLDQIDPSLAIGFYCRDRDDFDDFCSRAMELVDKSKGAPLFTVSQSLLVPNYAYSQEALDVLGGLSGISAVGANGACSSTPDDEWQIL